MKPYQGMRILDSTHVLAGPFCTYQLAWMGAEVIRLEATETRDFIRSASPDPELARLGMGDTFLAQNAGKRSIAVDLKSEAGQEVYRKLAATADVVVENFRPGVMQRLNCGYDAVAVVNPEVVYCSLTGFGQEGPLRDTPAYDHLIQAVSGMMSVMGSEERGPQRVGFPIIDYVVGLVGAFAISCALAEKIRHGKGQKIDVAMLDAALIIMMPVLAPWLNSGFLRENTGTAAFSGSPFSGTFQARDGYLAVVANTPEQAARMAKVTGRPDLMAAPEGSGWPNDPGLFQQVQSVLREVFPKRSVADWVKVFGEANVPAGPVHSIPEITAHPQLAGRGLFHTVPAPELGRDITIPGVGFKTGDGGGESLAPPPFKGSHTKYYLRELGYTEAEIAGLYRDGVVLSREKETAEGETG